MLQLTKKFAALPNGETLAYLEYGEGKNVLFLIHGNMSSSLHYLPLIERLPKDFRIIAPDMRGFGDSTYHHRFDSLHELADDLFELTKVLKLKSLTLVGWSTGGGVALSFASKHPSFVKKIVLIESMSYRGYPIFTKDASGKSVLGQAYKSKDEMAKDPIQVAPAVVAMQVKNFPWMSWLWDVSIYSNKKPTPEQNKLFIDETLKQRNLVDIDWSIASFNMGEGSNFYTMGDHSIKLVTAPVLSFWGKKDYVVLEYMVKETVAALGDHAKLVVFDTSGHSPLVDEPDALVEQIIHFAK
jgi:2-hydroxy-6-oxonona-2,4-dienedioate hydrolase